MENSKNTRRQFIKKSALAAAAGMALPHLLQADINGSPESGSAPGMGGEIELFTLSPLPYAYDALEPHIDRMTMEIHHGKHHLAYINNLNKAVKDENISIPLEAMLKKVSKYSASVRNNGGGHWNHSFFWKLMKPNGGGPPSGKLADAVNTSFGSFDRLKSLFNEAAMKRFGSGWAWLIVTKDGRLDIGSTPNQDNPLMDIAELKGKPVLALDVWEHAYYLKYQNKRADYTNAWWNVVNWEQAAANFDSAK